MRKKSENQHVFNVNASDRVIAGETVYNDEILVTINDPKEAFRIALLIMNQVELKKSDPNNSSPVTFSMFGAIDYNQKK